MLYVYLYSVPEECDSCHPPPPEPVSDPLGAASPLLRMLKGDVMLVKDPRHAGSHVLQRKEEGVLMVFLCDYSSIV